MDKEFIIHRTKVIDIKTIVEIKKVNIKNGEPIKVKDINVKNLDKCKSTIIETLYTIT